MYTSLLFPQPGRGTGIGDLSQPVTPEQAKSMLFSAIPTEVLNYRKEFAEELLSSSPLRDAFRLCAEIPNIALPKAQPSKEAAEYEKVTSFLAFATFFDTFCSFISPLIPQSRAAKRCFLTFRNYGESFEYRKRKTVALELIRQLHWDGGYSLFSQPSGAVRIVKETTLPDGICFALDRAVELLGRPPEEESLFPKERNNTETALLTGLLRRNESLFRAFRNFNADEPREYNDLLRIGAEAALYQSALFPDLPLPEMNFPEKSAGQCPLTGPSNRPAVRFDEVPTLYPRLQSLREDWSRLKTTALRERNAPAGISYEETFDILKQNAVSVTEHLRFLQRVGQYLPPDAFSHPETVAFLEEIHAYAHSPIFRTLWEQIAPYPLLSSQSAQSVLHLKTNRKGAVVSADLRYLGTNAAGYQRKYSYPSDTFSVSLPGDGWDGWTTCALGRLANGFCTLTKALRHVTSPLGESEE